MTDPTLSQVDARDARSRKVTDCPAWTLYGGRGRQAELHNLSAYEFVRHFHIKQAKYPFTVFNQDQDPEKYEAMLTDEGREKVQKKRATLIAEKDYVIREAGGEGWFPLGHGKLVKPYRHDWVISVRKRPNIPVIYGAQSSKTEEEQAMRILVLFFPWVNDAADATKEVPFINDLYPGPSERSWKDVLIAHASQVGFATEEVKRYTMNFIFTHCLPRQVRLVDGLQENSDNEDLADGVVDMVLNKEDLLEATLTHVRGSGRVAEEADCTQSDTDEEAEGRTKLFDMTMHMFGLSGAIWHGDKVGDISEAEERLAALRRGDGAAEINHDLALQSAKASATAGDKGEATRKTGLLGATVPEIEAGGLCACCAIGCATSFEGQFVQLSNTY